MSNRKVVCEGGVCRIVDSATGKGVLPLPSEDHWTVYGASWCPPCSKVKAILKKLCFKFDFIDIDKYEQPRKQLLKMCGRKTIPVVYCNGEYIGGYSETKNFLGV